MSVNSHTNSCIWMTHTKTETEEEKQVQLQRSVHIKITFTYKLPYAKELTLQKNLNIDIQCDEHQPSALTLHIMIKYITCNFCFLHLRYLQVLKLRQGSSENLLNMTK